MFIPTEIQIQTFSIFIFKGRCGHDRMVVGFTPTCAYHH